MGKIVLHIYKDQEIKPFKKSKNQTHHTKIIVKTQSPQNQQANKKYP
jgi:hypothetical protein